MGFAPQEYGDINQPRHDGEDSGKSFLFFLTVAHRRRDSPPCVGDDLGVIVKMR